MAGSNSAAELTAALKQKAHQLGFVRSGVALAGTAPRWESLCAWIDAGYAGQMRYLANRRDAYRHPQNVLTGVRSLLVLATPYRTEQPAPPKPGQGRIARYAWGEDYHDVVHDRLKALLAELARLAPGAHGRGVVDTAPLLEREWAQLAGLGWIGKNTLLLDRDLGSWFFLAALLTDAQLEPDAPFEADHCGTCTACLDACPTHAFVAPYVLDARRCISYLTIELRDHVSGELRSGIGDWVFGCDVCQDVCPWNHRATQTDEPAFQPHPSNNPLPLAELFHLDEAAFRARFRHTPLWRPRRRGLLRSAALVLGNQRDASAVAALARGLADAEPVVRAACAWALGQLSGDAPRRELAQQFEVERDDEVRVEIAAALKR